MSPVIAIHSRIFLISAVLVTALVAIAGAILLILKFALRKNVQSAWLAYQGWLVMIPIIALAIVLGQWAVIAGVTLLSAFGFREFARATGLERDRLVCGTVYFLVILNGAIVWVDRFDWFRAMPVLATTLLVILPIARNRVEGQLRSMSLSIFAFIYLCWMFAHIAWLANGPNPYGYLIFLLLATELNDVSAFTFGRLLGRRPLRDRISPRKTWGGALGAIVVSLMLPWFLRFLLSGLSGLELLAVGLAIGIGGQLGDLVISVIKRDLGVKDMGGGIPGHGGVLDRIDSLIFVAAPFLYLVRYVHGMG